MSRSQVTVDLCILTGGIWFRLFNREFFHYWNRKVVFRTAIYLSVFFLVFFAADRLLFKFISGSENLIYSGGDYFPILKEYIGKNRYDTLILGTSRTQDGIHPAYIEKKFGRRVIREADSGRGPRYNYHYYRKFRELAGAPSVVIYGVDYFIFSAESNRKFLTRFSEISSETEYDINQNSVSMLYKNKEKIDQMLNNSITEFKLRAGTNYKEQIIKELEYSKNYKGKAADIHNLITEKPGRLDYVGYTPFPGVEGDYFSRLLKLLDEDRVKVALVLLPDYYGTWVTNSEYKLFEEDIKSFSKRYKNVLVLNYSHPDKFPSKRSEYFRDGGYGNTNSHLSEKGAEYLFREMMQKDLGELYRKVSSDSGGLKQ